MIDRSLFTLPKIGMAFGVLAVFAVLEAFCVVGQAYGIAFAITQLWEGAEVSALVTYVVMFAACFVARQVLVFFRDTFLSGFARKRAEEVRSALLERVFTSNTHIVSQTGTAATASYALEGVDQVEAYLSVILPKMVNLVATCLVVLALSFALDWVSGLIMLAMFPVIVFYMVVLGRQAQEKAASQYASYNAMSNHFIDTLRGIDTLRAFGASRSAQDTIFKVSERFRGATIDTLKVATLSGGVLDLIATLGIAAVSLMLGFRLLDGTVALFNALMVLVMAPEFFKPIREFASDFHASLDGKNALAAITNIIEGSSHKEEDPHLPPYSNDTTLRLDDVSFSYAQDSETGAALDGITLEARGFMKIGLVGMSGSGKTTLVNIVGGFAKPSSGALLYDGVALDGLDVASWQEQVLYIPQDPYIFNTTLRENVAFYCPEAKESDVARAVSAVGLDPLVETLDDGMDTVIGEGGRGLSGGQAQRIALARALLDPTRKVLVFDEPTAHLDIETELELKEKMLPIMEGRLVFFATHRLHWLEAMDWIVVLEDGRIAEQGTLEDLVRANGALAALARSMREKSA